MKQSINPVERVTLEALLKGNSAKIPASTSLGCDTPVANLQDHSCSSVKKGEFLIFTATQNKTPSFSNSVKSLRQAGEFFLACGKKLKPAVLDVCHSLISYSLKILDTCAPGARKIVDCIAENSIKGDDVRLSKITEFYNTSIRSFPSTETQTEFPLAIGSPLYAITPNMTAETPPGISGNALESSNSMNYGAIGGAVGGAGVLIAGLSAFAGVWACKRKNLNKRRIKRCREMVASSLPKSSESIGLIPQNQLV